MRIFNGKIHKNDVQKAISKLVTAGLSPVLYHFTDLLRATKIMEDGEFMLSPAVGTGADKVHNTKLYFLSCSRIKFGGYARSKTSQTGVEFTLDGRRLSHKYSGSPVDYWGEYWRESVKNMGGNPNDVIESFLSKDENEDRIFSDDPSIPTDYVTEVHILFAAGPESEHYDKWYPNLVKLMRICKTSNIPCFVYDNVQDFKTHRKSNSIDFSEVPRYVSEPVERESRPQFPPRGYDEYLKVYHARKKEDLDTSSSSRLAYDLAYAYEFRLQELAKSLEADIHNSRTGRDGDRKEIAKVLALFKKEGCKDAREFIDVLAGKARKLYGVGE